MNKTASISLLVLLMFNPAMAQKRQQTVGDLLKKMSAETASNKAATALPTAEAFRGTQRKKIDYNSIKPPSSSEIFEKNDGSDKNRLEKITDQQISELYKLTTKFKNSPNRGELWLRLAELYVEKASLIEFRKQTEYEDKLAAYNAGKTKIKPEIDLKEKNAYHNKAIQLYEYFVRDFRGDTKMDQALFFLGYNFFEIGNVDKGAGYYTRLIKEHPRSPYVEEAYFALGDYHFENNRWAPALENYQKVMKVKSARLYPFSLYKGAWCQYRLGKTQIGLKYMESLIRMGRKEQKVAAGKRRINITKLEAEALRDIVVFYADANGPQQAYAYFTNLTGKDADNYVERLAYYYSDKGMRDESYLLFKQMIQRNPTAAKSFDYQYQIVTNYSNLSKSKEFKEELLTWISDYSNKSDWYKANQANAAVIENSEKLRESTLRNYILQNHQTAQNSRAPLSQQAALQGYALYIAEFDQSPHYADIRFFHGELLYDMKVYGKAGDEYRWVAENGKSKFAPKAAINMMLALERDLPPESALQKKIGNSADPIPMEARVERFVKAADWYLEKYPQGERVLEIRFKAGRLYYLSNQFNEAERHFREVVKRHPKSKQAEYSANLLLDIYNLKKDFKGMETAGQELLAIPELANSAAGKDIRTVLEKASFKKAQDLEVEKDYEESAENFANFARQNPGSPLAMNAWFNSAVNYERAGDTAAALVGYKMVLDSKDPKYQNLKEKSYPLAAKLYQNNGQFEKAAELFEISGEKLPRDPLAPNYFFNAAVLYEGMEKHSKAEANYLTYVKKTNSGDKEDVYFTLGEMFQRARKFTPAVDYYQKYIRSGMANKDRYVEAHFRIAESYTSARNMGEAKKWKAETVKVQKRISPEFKGPGAEFAAKIKVEQAQSTYQELKKITFTSDPAQQTRAAQKKKELLAQVTRELADIIRYDSPDEIVASLSILGQANIHMYESLTKAPIPKGLNAEEEKQYREGIAQFAEPFLKAGKESHFAAVQRGQDLEALNEHYVFSLDMVKGFDPNHHYDKGERLKAEPVINWMDL